MTRFEIIRIIETDRLWREFYEIWGQVETGPWLPYLATEYIKRLQPHRVFEWGSGESTNFFMDLPGIRHLISIEHDSNWFVDRSIPPFVRCYLIPPEPGWLGDNPGNPDHYRTGSTNFGPVNFKKYASAIDERGLFDLILIDGMARASCIKHAFSHVAPRGCMVIDNTGDRPYYLEQTAQLFGNYDAGWERVDFMGYGPTLAYKWQTTFFINRTKVDYESTR